MRLANRFSRTAAWLKVLLLATLLCLFCGAKAYAQAFAACTSDMFIAQNSPTALFRVDTSTNPFTYPQIGVTSSLTYNAIAFNPADNYLYGVTWNNSTKQVNLLRIASNGSVTNAGAITGGGINSNGVAPASGEIGADGYYYLKFNTPGTGGGVLYRVNLSNLSATTATTLSRDLPSADLAWYNGALYSHNMDNGSLYKINPSTGAVTIIGASGVNSAFGALVSAANGIFGVNNNGGFYQFNPATGKATLISSSPSSNNNDGAKCLSTPLVFGADLAVTKTDNHNFYIPGSTTTYAIVVSNNGPFGVEEAVINDALPAGISKATWTCATGANGGTCGSVSGTGAISGVTVDLPPNASVTFTMTLTIPSGYSGNLVNTITVTPPSTASDPNPANNSATDTDAGITIAKSLFAESGMVANAAEPGETLTYHVTLTNTGSIPVTGYGATDKLDANTAFVSADNGGSATNGIITWANLSIPASGSLVLTMVATVNDPLPGSATSVTNIAYATGESDPPCPSTQCVITPVAGKIAITKQLLTESGAQTGIAEPGETLTYRIRLSNTGSATTGYNLIDMIDTNVAFVGADNGGINTGNQISWTNLSIPAASGGVPGELDVTVTVRVADSLPAGVTAIRNLARADTEPDPPCPSSQCVITPTTGKITITKTLVEENGFQRGLTEYGETLIYRITLTNTGGSDVVNYAVDDVLDVNLEFVAADQGGVLNGRTISWSNLTVSTAPASVVLTVMARVVNPLPPNVTQVINLAKPTGDPDPPCPSDQCVVTPVASKPVITYAKTANATQVKVGDIITYTVVVNIADARTNALVTLTDTLGTGLTFNAVTEADAFTCNASLSLVCTLPAGTAIGVYGLVYTATINADASGSVRNAVIASGDDDPVCASLCTTEQTVIAPEVSYAKTADTTGPVKVGDTITYTLSTTVANAGTASDVVLLTDTLGTGLSFGHVVDAGDYQVDTSGAPVERFTLPAGKAPGTYTVSYTAIVNDQASGAVRNAVVGSGRDNPVCTTGCGTEIPVAVQPAVSVVKSADVSDGSSVRPGQSIHFTLTATIGQAALAEPVILTDTPDPGFTLSVPPAGCTLNGASLVCTLPAGTAVGIHAFTYIATVNSGAGTTVKNQVTTTGGGGNGPTCTICSISYTVEQPDIRLSKTSAVRTVTIGDLVRYTLTVENVGAQALSGGYIVDTPSAGFFYVEGSLRVSGDDTAVTVSGQSPLRFDGIDLAAGKAATLVYLMRVGAGVRPGTQTNTALTYDPGDTAVSNPASARVELVADPLLDDSLIFGSVFDDRDGDGWQDSAGLNKLHVSGGFAPGAYVGGSTVILRGTVASSTDASLLQGMNLGDLPGRQSDADPVDQIVIRQTLSALAFDDSFILTDHEGVTLHMDAAGRTRIIRSGDASKGLNGAELSVARHVAPAESGYIVEYVIRNAGVDERGIPGVRVASVEGLRVETDPYGRYHLAGISGGTWERGRNFILKVDPATLPRGARFTTPNPLLRRITPGLPVRFDWGVRLPPAVLSGGYRQLELELGTVIFAPGSAEIGQAYGPVIDKLADKIRMFHGGDVVIDSRGETEALAMKRAEAVRAALLARLDADTAQNLTLSVREQVDAPASTIVTLKPERISLGTVLFATDKADIQPRFAPLLDEIAATIGRAGGGVITLVGHTDVRGSLNYNTALGLRRARSVQEALAQRLPPDLKDKVRVEISPSVKEEPDS